MITPTVSLTCTAVQKLFLIRTYANNASTLILLLLLNSSSITADTTTVINKIATVTSIAAD